jgi:hypothetical protein
VVKLTTTGTGNVESGCLMGHLALKSAPISLIILQLNEEEI